MRDRKTNSSIQKQRGASLVELAAIVTFLLLLTLGVIDFGRGYYLGIEVANAANAGAQYGLQNPGDGSLITDMAQAAKNDAADVTSWAGGYPQAVTGCMCSDGSQQSVNCGTTPNCTAGTQEVSYVTVQTRATYTPMFPWPGVPASITLNGSATYWTGQ